MRKIKFNLLMICSFVIVLVLSLSLCSCDLPFMQEENQENKKIEYELVEYISFDNKKHNYDENYEYFFLTLDEKEKTVCIKFKSLEEDEEKITYGTYKESENGYIIIINGISYFFDTAKKEFTVSLITFIFKEK